MLSFVALNVHCHVVSDRYTSSYPVHLQCIEREINDMVAQIVPFKFRKPEIKTNVN